MKWLKQTPRQVAIFTKTSTERMEIVDRTEGTRAEMATAIQRNSGANVTFVCEALQRPVVSSMRQRYELFGCLLMVVLSGCGTTGNVWTSLGGGSRQSLSSHVEARSPWDATNTPLEHTAAGTGKTDPHRGAHQAVGQSRSIDPLAALAKQPQTPLQTGTAQEPAGDATSPSADAPTLPVQWTTPARTAQNQSQLSPLAESNVPVLSQACSCAAPYGVGAAQESLMSASLEAVACREERESLLRQQAERIAAFDEKLEDLKRQMAAQRTQIDELKQAKFVAEQRYEQVSTQLQACRREMVRIETQMLQQHDDDLRILDELSEHLQVLIEASGPSDALGPERLRGTPKP